MIPIDFPESNKNLLKPSSMSDAECGSLPVLTDGKTCVSLWKASIKERLSILFFGKIWLYVYSGHTQPPVVLIGQKTIFESRMNEQ